MKKKPLVVLTGPTAVGKTKASIGLAKAIGGEIISADSMQVYGYRFREDTSRRDAGDSSLSGRRIKAMGRIPCSPFPADGKKSYGTNLR